MAMYATVADLASYLQKDLDTASATLALTVASDLFAQAANTRFEATSTTYTRAGDGSCHLFLPHTPVVSVSAVRINSVAVTDFTLIGDVLFRAVGFGWLYAFPPDKVEVDYVHGYATVPDDVRGAVLETAGAAYQSPDITTLSESIDDYSVKSVPNAGGVGLSYAAQATARMYRGVLVG